MDEKSIIFKGELAKYQLKITRMDFNVQTCDFSVRLSWGLFGQYIDIPKSEMYHDEEWNIFFMFDTTNMLGPIKATTTYYIPDTDVEDDLRECTDMQLIGFVTETACLQMQRCKCQKSAYVEFTRVNRSDARTLYLNLKTSEGEYLKDSDGKQLRVRKEEKDIC